MQLQSYASDLLEDAQILAQTKALNSYSFRDTINSLTELWGYCYERIAEIDPGFYSQTMEIRQQLTRLPPFVKNTVRVYSARDPVGFSRKLYKEAGMNDLQASFTFHISGRDLYCRDGGLRTVWLEYVPEPPFITFTRNNRDPTILWRPTDTTPMPVGNYGNRLYGMYKLLPDDVYDPIQDQIVAGDDNQPIIDQQYFRFRHRASGEVVDRTSTIIRQGWKLIAFILDHPWCFTTYESIDAPEIHESFVTQGVLRDIPPTLYNPFDYQGRGSNVKFLKARYNDYTGLGVHILDFSDGCVKELGFTPDTLMVYPSRVMYNYMVATLAQRFAALNNSTNMAVELALVQSEDEMGKWLKLNKSAWTRANNVTGPTLADYI